jgi:4-diphosphocytidyl-2-C-methyl-D-erythritol kinase
MHPIKVKSKAKINLALRILYKRKDGYHEIESIFQEISFADTLYLAKANEIRFSSDYPPFSMEDNLCVKAARLLQKQFQIPGLAIKLEKRIPVGAGLGGGSSNAAVVLKGGMQLYKIQTKWPDILAMAAQLGSDVPFFLNGKTAYVWGRGERLEPINLTTEYCIVLVLPKIEISTAWAYKNMKLTLTKKNADYKFKSFTFHKMNVSDFKHNFQNDFEKMVFETQPELEKIKQMLYTYGADYASLSGSGSSIFGVFVSKSSALTASKILSKEFSCCLVNPV